MSFTINTNMASLQAQSYLQETSDFQSKTLQRVTSGLRIVQAGDDAAGLAIANGYRSDQAVLTQGVRNANDALSQLQIMDGGMSNISKLLDRARTLATESASDTFSGNRTVLNNEFADVMAEIDRQAQNIGLDNNGQFAATLKVFIGGGKDGSGNAQNIIDHGSVSLALGGAKVDTLGLGLTKNLKATVSTGTVDVSGGAKAILDAANSGAGTPSVTFRLAVGTSTVDVTVNTTNLTSDADFVNRLNAGIQAASSSTSGVAAANVHAAISGGALTFTSTVEGATAGQGMAFSVTAVDNGAASVFNTKATATAAAAEASAHNYSYSIADMTSAESAVSALSKATQQLGLAQATVGRGENVLNYAVNLAQSQSTNMAAAESRIRDADLAAEAANMTKAQILLQAGVAALAQANAAPQQVLTLLRG
jgi:flagellin